MRVQEKVFHGKRVYRVEHGHATPVGARESVRRARNLGLIFAACERSEEKLAELLYLPLSSVKRLLSGEQPISNELAMHIEMQCGLPGGWLDDIQPTLPNDVQARIKAFHSEDAHPEPEEKAAVPAQETEAVKTQAVASPPEKKKGRPFSISLDLAEKRRQTLIKALEEMGKGSRVRIAKEVGVDISVVSSWVMGRRRITDTYAKRIMEKFPFIDLNGEASQARDAVTADEVKPSEQVWPSTSDKVEAERQGKVEEIQREDVAKPVALMLKAAEQARDAVIAEVEALRKICLRRIEQERDERRLLRVLIDLVDEGEHT